MLLAECPGTFMCHCSNTGIEWTLNKSQHILNKNQHTKLTLEKKILPQPLVEFELTIFWSQVPQSTNKLFPALACKSPFLQSIINFCTWRCYVCDTEIGLDQGITTVCMLYIMCTYLQIVKQVYLPKTVLIHSGAETKETTGNYIFVFFLRPQNTASTFLN